LIKEVLLVVVPPVVLDVLVFVVCANAPQTAKAATAAAIICFFMALALLFLTTDLCQLTNIYWLNCKNNQGYCH
jgi:hypothetical protein